MTSNEPERRKPPSGPLTSGTAHAYIEDKNGESTATGKENAEEVKSSDVVAVYTDHDDIRNVVPGDVPKDSGFPLEPDAAGESGAASS